MEQTIAHEFDAMDFQRLLGVLLRRAWALGLGILLLGGGAFIYSMLQTPVYMASTNILVTRNSQQSIGDVSQSLSITQLVDTYKNMLVLDEFLAIVSQRLRYEVDGRNITVRALPNTQIIEVQVLDPDPAQAARIADAMVVVLTEQNETLQAGRYGEAEQNLNQQIKDVEIHISAVQAELDTAQANALVDQVAEAKTNIDSTVEVIQVTVAELERLDKMTWESARFQLKYAKDALITQQATLDRRIAERDQLKQDLASNVLAQTDPNYAANLQERISYLEGKVSEIQAKIQEIQNEIIFLTPLDTKKGFDAAIVEKESFLATQQSLLASYQNVYTKLLSTEEVERKTNAIDKLEKDLDLYQKIYLSLLNNLEEVKNQKMQNIPTLLQVSPASAGEEPVRPRTLSNTLLGGLLGLMLAGGVVVVLETTSNTVKSREQVELLFGASVIGYIITIDGENDGDGIYVARAPRSPVAEAFRFLRTTLEFSAVDKPIKTILVTSSSASEGKTTIAANLAASLAHKGKKVLLMDADLRRPRIHRYVGISNQSGLSDLITPENREDVNLCIQKLENIPNLSILPSGGLPPNPTDLLGSEEMNRLLRTLSESHDYIVIDSPPMMVPDSHVLSGMVDGILLVMVPGQVPRDVAGAITEQMKQSNARLLGVVFNRLKTSRRPGYGGYSYPYYYSSDYYSSNDEQAADGRRKIKPSSGSRTGKNKKGAKPSVPDKEKPA